MFGPSGHAYVYLIYGMYDMLNIVAGELGSGQAVLIRAAEAMDGWQADLGGPGKLARAMRITRAQNGLDLTGVDLFLIHGPRPEKIERTVRIGVDYAEHWKDAPLRFTDAASSALSRRIAAPLLPPPVFRGRAGEAVDLPKRSGVTGASKSAVRSTIQPPP